MCEINEHISIVIPTVGDIIDNEESYYSSVYMLTAMPIDMMVQLDDIGIDFSKINSYDLFLLTFESLKRNDLSMIFGNLDVSSFELAMNSQNNTMVLLDRERGIVIDRAIYEKIADTLREIHHLEKNLKKPGNEEARKFMLERARTKLKRRRKRKEKSQLEPLIVAMVNTEQFKYDYLQVRNLTIYQFNESVRQIINKVDYENKMFGVYTGTINAKELSQDDFNWLSHK